MKKTVTCLLLLLFTAATGVNCSEPQKQEQQLSYFRLNDVELLESPFLDAQQTDLRYIMSLDPDRLLAPFLREAGLIPKAESYPDWEAGGLGGQTGGHCLSALSMMWASTGDAAVKERLDYMLGELRRAQEASGNGFVGGTPGSKELWEQVKAGDIRATGFDLNGKWVPLYNMHKTYAGLRDAYIHAGSDLARRMLVELTDWMIGVTSGLSDEQIQQMLRCEHGGLNETFADVAAITGDAKYLELARRFSDRKILDPLVHRADSLTGLHANTQIPKVIGFERIAGLSQDDPAWEHASEWDGAARFFWDTVVDNRSVVIGGNSVREHFHPADDYSALLEDVQGPETCNTYNMLRLTKMLYKATPETRFADYYERALYNHILASQHPVNGGFVYFTPMRAGHYRVYSSAQESTWCCVGSGMENHSKYGEFIYAHTGDALWVNLFIPSRLTWEERGVVLAQQTRFPDEEQIRFTVEQTDGKPFDLRMRYPGWAKNARLSINGKPQNVETEPGNFISVERRWKVGDEIVLELPMEVRTEQIPDGKEYRAFLYGPVVLAAPMGTDDLEGLYAHGGRMAHVAHGRQIPAEEIPALDAADPGSLPAMLRKTDDGEVAFTYTGELDPAQAEELRFIPFFRLHDSRYAIYFRTAR